MALPQSLHGAPPTFTLSEGFANGCLPPALNVFMCTSGHTGAEWPTDYRLGNAIGGVCERDNSMPEPLHQTRAPEAASQQGCLKCLHKHTRKPKGNNIADGEVKIRFQDGFNSRPRES